MGDYEMTPTEMEAQIKGQSVVDEAMFSKKRDGKTQRFGVSKSTNRIDRKE
jgi:hypothetical protein